MINAVSRTSTTHIGGHEVKHDDISRTIIINQEYIIRLTPSENRLFVVFITSRIGSDNQLACALLQRENVSIDRYIKETINKHVDNLRSKLRGYGLEIRRIFDYGYVLMPTV